MSTYNLDPTGKTLQNVVIGETKTLNLPANRTNLFVVPRFGPFFEESLFVKYTDTSGVSTNLIVGVDYWAGFRFNDATRKANAPIYGAIVLADNTRTGTITFNYHALGGAFELTTTQIADIQANEARDPKITTWELVATPLVFPTVDHPWAVVNVPDITKAVAELSKAGLVVHLRPKFLSNPNSVEFIPTKAEIGLGNVDNFKVATLSEALSGTSSVTLMTPASTMQVITPAVAAALIAIGYKIPAIYVAGMELTSVTNTVLYADQIYAPKEQFLPFTTSGNFETPNFELVVSNKKSSWTHKTFNIVGNEPLIANQKHFNIATTHDSRIAPQLYLNDIIFLVFGIDYNINDQTLLVTYPLEADDVLSLFVKDPLSNLLGDKTIYQKIVVSNGSNTFTLDNSGINVDNLRITVNDFFILVKDIDYTISPSNVVTVSYPLIIDDVLEIENIDSMPALGKAITKEFTFK